MKRVALVCALLLAGCAVIARTQYGLTLDACIDQAHNRAEADQCIKTVQLKWDEAGAKPALVFDGGAE